MTEFVLFFGLFGRAISFLSEALSNYTTPDGVTFNSCPFVPERPVPLVGLFQHEPEVRSQLYALVLKEIICLYLS